MSQIPQTTGHSLGEVCKEFTRLKFHPSFLLLHHKPGKLFLIERSDPKKKTFTLFDIFSTVKSVFKTCPVRSKIDLKFFASAFCTSRLTC